MADVVCKSGQVLDTARWGQMSASGASQAKKAAASLGFPPSSTAFESLKSSASSGFHGRKVVDVGRDEMPGRHIKGGLQAVPAQMNLTIGKAMRWWEKGVQTNMKEISSAEDLVDSLLNAGDKLVIVDFFSPGCGGCRALHPKICQFAETNPEVTFLQVNYELHKSMCYSLNIHVLPFFRFYRGAQGRLCSFSCTNATIKKFKDALAKHNPDRCSLGPAKGLEESELLALAANRDLCFTYSRKPEPVLAYHELEQIVPSDSNLTISATLKSTMESEGKLDLYTASR